MEAITDTAKRNAMVQWMSGSGRAAALVESFLLNLGPLIKSVLDPLADMFKAWNIMIARSMCLERTPFIIVNDDPTGISIASINFVVFHSEPLEGTTLHA